MKKEKDQGSISVLAHIYLQKFQKPSKNVTVEGKSGAGDTGRRESSLSVPFCTLWIWNHVNV